AAPSRTSDSVISTRSSPERSTVRTWRGSCDSLPGEAEHRLRQRLGRLSSLPLLRGTKVTGEQERLQGQLRSLRAESTSTEEETWEYGEPARHPERPYTLDYVGRILDDWVELHGDRGRADDGAIVAGVGRLAGRTIALVGHQKGREVKERVDRQFGMPHPEGYAKAMRIMDLAERFGFPFVSLVDTPGAYPGVAAEQHGQGGAIARSQAKMIALGVPTVACVIGEGMSGGAVAIAAADVVLMQQNAIYAVISPEGCAAILWRDIAEAKKAAAAFRLDAADSLDLGVIAAIVPEPEGGAGGGGPGGGWRAGGRGSRRRGGGARSSLPCRAPPAPPQEVPADGGLRMICRESPVFPHDPQAFQRVDKCAEARRRRAPSAYPPSGGGARNRFVRPRAR